MLQNKRWNKGRYPKIKNDTLFGKRSRGGRWIVWYLFDNQLFIFFSRDWLAITASGNSKNIL